MISQKNKITLFKCDVCECEKQRAATTMDYLGKYILPVRWTSYHVFNSYLQFCSNTLCQNVFKKLNVNHKT